MDELDLEGEAHNKYSIEDRTRLKIEELKREDPKFGLGNVNRQYGGGIEVNKLEITHNSTREVPYN